MALQGTGLLALWNGFAADRLAEYNLWHTREHLPERLSVPGILGARRYVDPDGPLPAFLTLYELTSTAVLTSAPYRDLLANPTAWSLGMRPSFSDFLRLGCAITHSAGAGIGGFILATTLDAADLTKLTSDSGALVGLLDLPAVTAAHLVRVDPDVPAVPFGGAAPALPADAALFVEGYDRAALSGAREAIAAALAAAGVMPAPPYWTTYALAYALTAGDRHAAVDYVRPAPLPAT